MGFSKKKNKEEEAKNAIKDPLLLLEKYVDEKKLTSNEKLTPIISKSAEYDKLKVERMNYSQYRKVIEYATSTESEKNVGVPTCLTVKITD